jgi:hypothetical protein
MSLKRDLTLRNERSTDITPLRSYQVTLDIGIGLRQTQTENNEQDRRTGTKPVKRTPSVGRSIDETSRKSRREKVAKRITLLQHPGDHTTRLLRTILQRRRSRITVEPTHRNTKQGAAGQELLVGLTEPRTELEHDEEDIIDDERPLPTISIGRDTEDDGPDGAEHQHQRDAPCDLGIGLIERDREVRDGQADGEEIERVPGLRGSVTGGGGVEFATYPCEEGDEEEKPLFPAQHHEEVDGVGCLVHRRLEGGEARESIFLRGHLVRWLGFRDSIVASPGGRNLLVGSKEVSHDGEGSCCVEWALESVSRDALKEVQTCSDSLLPRGSTTNIYKRIKGLEHNKRTVRS